MVRSHLELDVVACVVSVRWAGRMLSEGRHQSQAVYMTPKKHYLSYVSSATREEKQESVTR